ncbi:MAG TPA: DUF1588 domain-containing protein [Polyangiaceae bacterium]|nr:DUF1588 domain-containing protein [Polyangiaceae bacterium]
MRYVVLIRALPVAAATWSLACTSGLASPSTNSGADPGAASGAGGVDANSGRGGAGAPTPIDQAQQAMNPDLFEVASRFFPTLSTASAPKRVFRLTRRQLDNTTKSLLPAHFHSEAVTSVPADPLQTNYEYADNLSFNPANFTPYTQWISQLVDSVRAQPEAVIACTAEGNAPSCLEREATRFVRKAFRGVASDAQLAHYTSFFQSRVKDVGIASATADLVDLTLTSPNYVFRDEVSTNGSGSLAAAQLLQNISYTLTDSPPEALGLSSLEPESAVQSASDLQATLDHVLASDAARTKLLQFFMSWLEVRAPAEFGISTEVFPEFTPQVASAVVQETRAFLERQLASDVPRLRDLTEATETVVSDDMAFIYGLSKGSPGSVTLDPAQRLGVFTLPGVIASHSGPTTTRLVKRGVFFTRKVMCLPLGNPPPGIDTSLPVASGASERQRVESGTTHAPCSGCHRYINPFGFMLENYDAIGRFRTSDQGVPVDPSISVDFVDGVPFEADTPVTALKGFTRSKQFQQCFARQLFRFYLGRDETADDDPILRQMFFDFANQDQQDILKMLRTLAGSSALSRRSEAP